jgi:hypothetical protein
VHFSPEPFHSSRPIHGLSLYHPWQADVTRVSAAEDPSRVLMVRFGPSAAGLEGASKKVSKLAPKKYGHQFQHAFSGPDGREERRG